MHRITILSLIPGATKSRLPRNQLWVILLLLLLASCASPTSLRRTSNTALNRVITEAEDLIGSSYCSRGATPDCFDCSGFTSWCFVRGGVRLPRTSKDQFAAGSPIIPPIAPATPTPLFSPDLDLLEPGDLVFFITYGTDVSHVGIYAGDNTFVHASTSRGVIVSSMHEPYWRTRFVGARRILEQ